MGGRHISVGFSMPHGYPEEQAVSVTVKCGGGVSRSEHEAINMGAREVAREHIGQEAILQVLQRVQVPEYLFFKSGSKFSMLFLLSATSVEYGL
jgi:hypothetical protein